MNAEEHDRIASIDLLGSNKNGSPTIRAKIYLFLMRSLSFILAMFFMGSFCLCLYLVLRVFYYSVMDFRQGGLLDLIFIIIFSLLALLFYRLGLRYLRISLLRLTTDHGQLDKMTAQKYLVQTKFSPFVYYGMGSFFMLGSIGGIVIGLKRLLSMWVGPIGAGETLMIFVFTLILLGFYWKAGIPAARDFFRYGRKQKEKQRQRDSK